MIAKKCRETYAIKKSDGWRIQAGGAKRFTHGAFGCTTQRKIRGSACSSTGASVRRRVDYVPRLLKTAGVDQAKLPGLLPVDAVLGTIKTDVAAKLGLMPSARVGMGSCDGHAPDVGAGSTSDLWRRVAAGPGFENRHPYDLGIRARR